MNIGDKVEVTCVLRSAGWVGKTRPVIKYEFDDAAGNNYVAFSTANWLKDVGINESVKLRATIGNMNQTGVVLSKPRPVY